MEQKQLTQMQKATLLQLRHDLEKVMSELQKMETDVDMLLKLEKNHIREFEKLHGVVESTKSAVEQMLKKNINAMGELERISKQMHQTANLYYVLSEELHTIIDPLEDDDASSSPIKKE